MCFVRQAEYKSPRKINSIFGEIDDRSPISYHSYNIYLTNFPIGSLNIKLSFDLRCEWVDDSNRTRSTREEENLYSFLNCPWFFCFCYVLDSFLAKFFITLKAFTSSSRSHFMLFLERKRQKIVLVITIDCGLFNGNGKNCISFCGPILFTRKSQHKIFSHIFRERIL